jgi:hypothetical protein
MSKELLNPRGIFHIEENPIAPRLPDLDGKLLGLIDNTKDNADLFLNALHRLIGDRHQIPDIIRIIKPGAAEPASFSRDFLDKCDFVINAIGD